MCDNDIVISQIALNDASVDNQDHSTLRDEHAKETSVKNEISKWPLQRDSANYDDTSNQLIATCAYCGLREIIL